MQDTNKKLYVGSLPYSTTEEDLRELFTPFGQVVTARIIADKFTGQSKGFGFVEMETTESAQKAIDEMNGAELGGRTLIVNLARPPQERDRSERGGGGGHRERRGSWGGEDRGGFRPRRGE
jgi:RNA recognition motif-containing protein